MKYLKEEKIEKTDRISNWALNKFFISNKQIIENNLGEKLINE
jgi:ERCC4-related helicase